MSKTTGKQLAYMSDFGNDFETEVLPDAPSQGRNSPQRCNYGQYVDCFASIENKFDGTPGLK